MIKKYGEDTDPRINTGQNPLPTTLNDFSSNHGFVGLVAAMWWWKKKQGLGQNALRVKDPVP